MIDFTKLPGEGGSDWKPSQGFNFLGGTPSTKVISPPSPFNFPEMPQALQDVFPGIRGPWVQGLWETAHRRPEYRNPEYTAYMEQYPEAERAPFEHYTEWGEGQEPVTRHMREAFGWSPEDINRVIGAWFGGDDPTPPVPPVPPGPGPDVPPGPGEPPPPGEDEWPPPEAGAPESIYGGYPPTTTPFPYPSQWGTASNVLERFAYGLPTQISPGWEEATGYARQMAETGLPTAMPEAWTSAAMGAEEMARTGLPTPVPQEWTAASRAATEALGTGLPTPVPQAWTSAEQAAQQMLKGGMPVDVGGWWEAQQPVLERRISDLAKQQTEQAGLAGLRWSEPLQRSITDITGRETAGLWADFAGRDIAAQEAARARMMGAVPQLTQIGAGQAGLEEAARERQMAAIPQLGQIGRDVAGLTEAAAQRQLAALPIQYQLGAGEAGLTEAAKMRQAAAVPMMFQAGQMPMQLAEAAKDRGLTAAQSLIPLGQAYFQAPMDWSAQMMGMGGQMQGLQQAALGRQYQDFMRMTPEASPWLSGAMGFLGLPSQMAPQQYQPSMLSQLFSALGLGAGMYAGLK